MKIYATDKGDRSVGIPPIDLTISLNYDLKDFNAEEKGYIKEDIIKFIKDNFDPIGKITVMFEGE